MRYSLVALSLLASLGCASISGADPFAEIKPFDRSAHSRAITECDMLAGHPEDPERVTDGVEQAEMQKEAAIAACLAALEKDANNPRLNYQLYRAYSYLNRHAEAVPYGAKALHAGYPQTLFVAGFIRIEGWDGREPDPCYGGELVRRSAHAGRFAGQVGFPHYVQTGTFDECASYPVIDKEEIMTFLNQAEREADGYYRQILVSTLKAHFAAQ